MRYLAVQHLIVGPVKQLELKYRRPVLQILCCLQRLVVLHSLQVVLHYSVRNTGRSRLYDEKFFDLSLTTFRFRKFKVYLINQQLVQSYPQQDDNPGSNHNQDNLIPISLPVDVSNNQVEDCRKLASEVDVSNLQKSHEYLN